MRTVLVVKPQRESAAPMVTAAGFAAFLLLGSVQASYGPSIPHIASRFGVSVGASGLVVSAYFLGECIGVAMLGLTESRWGFGRRLSVSTALFSLGLLAAAAAPAWPLLLLAVCVAGCGAGGLVILINVYFATRFGTRSPAMLSFVNAVYGVGSFLGPALIGLTSSYSEVFVGVAALALVCLAAFARSPSAPPPTLLPADIVSGRRLGLVLAFAALLFVYEGLEAGVGAWEATDLVSLGSSVQFAAAATSLYWIAFTVGRAVSAPLVARMSAPGLLFGLLTVATLVLVGIRAHLYAPLGFALVGLCAAPIFPVVLPWIAKVVPNATTAMTYAILGAIIGSAIVPAALGGLISVAGIQALPLGIAACAVATFGLVAMISFRLRI
jgi:FHS family glucose/mannose:H+ symporter-like MFS transporter